MRGAPSTSRRSARTTSIASRCARPRERALWLGRDGRRRSALYRTRDPRRSRRRRARAGGYGSSDADGAVRGANGVLSYSAAAARHSTDGFQAFNSGYRQTVGSGIVVAQGLRSDASLSLRYSDNQFHFPTDGSGRVVDSNAVHGDDRLAVGVDAGYRLTPLAEMRVSLASSDIHGLTTDQPNSPGDTNGYYYSTPEKSRRRSAELRFALGLPAASSLTLGTRFEREWRFESRTTDNFGGSVDSSHSRNTTGLYAQLLTSPLAALTTTLGARFEHNDQFGDFVTYRAAASSAVAQGTRVRASIGTAFREPTFLENYGSAFVIGNPALNPERSLSVDAGVEQRIGDALLGVTAFQNTFRNLIDYAYSASAPNYNNIARTRTRGVEVEARATIIDGLHADGEFTYLDARVIDRGASSAPTAAFATGARLLRRPMHTLDGDSGTASLRWPSRFARITWARAKTVITAAPACRASRSRRTRERTPRRSCACSKATSGQSLLHCAPRMSSTCCTRMSRGTTMTSPTGPMRQSPRPDTAGRVDDSSVACASCSSLRAPPRSGRSPEGTRECRRVRRYHCAWSRRTTITPWPWGANG
jgi:Outer membrane cobalamin receptor protein